MGKFWRPSDFEKIKGKRGIFHGVPATVVYCDNVKGIVVQLDKADYFGIDLPEVRLSLGLKRKHHRGANNIFAILKDSFPIEIPDEEPECKLIQKFAIGEKAISPLGPCTIIGQVGEPHLWEKYIVRLGKEIGWSSHPMFPNFKSSKNDLWLFLGWELKKVKPAPIEWRVQQVNTTIIVYDAKGHKGVAKCHPDDTFDFGYGVSLAQARCTGYTRYIPKSGEWYFRCGSPVQKQFDWNDETCYNDILVGNIFKTAIECDAFSRIVRENRTKLLKGVLHEDYHI